MLQHPPHEHFAAALADDLTPTDAAARAGYCVPGSVALRLASLSATQARCREIIAYRRSCGPAPEINALWDLAARASRLNTPAGFKLAGRCMVDIANLQPKAPTEC